MKKVNMKELPVIFQKEGIKAKRIYDREAAQANVITIEPGYTLPLHTVPVDIFMFVLEGKGRFTIGDERFELTKHELIEGPKDVPHGIENTGNDPLKVLVVKAPRG